MLVWLNEFLEKCKKGSETRQILLNVNGKVIPMGKQYYIVDSIWYVLISFNGNDYIDNDEFIDIVERECINNADEWGDLYTSPMDDIGNCELRFADESVGTNIEKEYEILKIVEDDKNIIINLIDKE